MAPLMSSVRMDWCTPGVVLSLVRQVGPIDLDPCGNREANVGARVTLYAPENDGLTYQWRIPRSGLIYVNPPYGRALAAWGRKVREEMSFGADLVTLVPARTDTRWWADMVANATAVCFWRGRLTFAGAPAPAPFPSALIMRGGPAATGRFVEVFQPYGWIVEPRKG